MPLTKWWMATHMFNPGKNGVSAHEIHRNLGVTYKTAWFMMHRLREAMGTVKPLPWAAKADRFRPMRRTTEIRRKRAKGYKKGH